MEVVASARRRRDAHLTEDHLVVSRLIPFLRPRRIPYENVQGLEVWRSLGTRLVVTARGRLPIRLPARILRSGFMEALRARIAQLPDGEARLQKIDVRAATAAWVCGGQPPVTLSLFLVLVLVFVIEVRVGALESMFHLVLLGAHSGPLVAAGEWQRLFSYALLHYADWHFGLNAGALLAVGYHVERLVGSAVYAVALVASALAGALATAGLGVFVLTGASGMLHGAAGALLAVQFTHRDELPGNLLLPAFLLPVLIAGLVLEAFVPHLGWLCHVGGLAAGVATTALLLRGRSLPAHSRRTARGPALLAAGALIVAAAAEAAAVRNALARWDTPYTVEEVMGMTRAELELRFEQTHGHTRSR